MKLSPLILAFLLMVSCASITERPHIAVPQQFAVRSILVDQSGKTPDVLDLLVCRGDTWCFELADPELQTVKIWVGKNTNIVVASHETTLEQTVKIPNMVSYFANLHKSSNDPDLPFLGSDILDENPCWVYRSKEGVTMYFRKSDGLLIKEIYDHWTTDYTYLDFTDTDYNKSLDTSNKRLNSSILKNIYTEQAVPGYPPQGVGSPDP